VVGKDDGAWCSARVEKQSRRWPASGILSEGPIRASEARKGELGMVTERERRGSGITSCLLAACASM